MIWSSLCYIEYQGNYLMLHRKYNACLQIGGDDQWGNIVAGIDLIRRLTMYGVYTAP